MNTTYVIRKSPRPGYYIVIQDGQVLDVDLVSSLMRRWPSLRDRLRPLLLVPDTSD
jgi:hypothetical protein